MSGEWLITYHASRIPHHEKYPDVEWKEAVGFRNMLIHVSNGLTPEDIIRDYYENITREDILVCIRYAGSLVEDQNN